MTYTYVPVTPSDDITIGATTFIHFYNYTAYNDAIVFYAGSAACKTALLPAGEELFLGPFDIDTYGSTITVTHTCAAVSQLAESGVVMAVITPAAPLAETPFMVDTSITGAFYNVELMNTFDISMNSKMVDVTPAFQDELWTVTESPCVYNPDVGLSSLSCVYSPKPNIWTQQRPTLNSMTFSGAGFFDYYNDITGQQLIMDNAVNGAALAGRAYLTSFSGSTSYITAQLVVTDFTIRTNPHGMVEFSFTADSTGAVTFTT